MDPLSRLMAMSVDELRTWLLIDCPKTASVVGIVTPFLASKLNTGVHAYRKHKVPIQILFTANSWCCRSLLKDFLRHDSVQSPRFRYSVRNGNIGVKAFLRGSLVQWLLPFSLPTYN